MNEEKYREASQVAFDYVVETDQHNLTDVVRKNLQNAQLLILVIKNSSTNIIFQFDFFSTWRCARYGVLAYMELRISMYVMHIRCEIHAPIANVTMKRPHYCIDETRKRFQFIYIHLFPVKTFDMMTAER
jgi:hypothetical protein